MSESQVKAVKSDPMRSDPMRMSFPELLVEWRLATSGKVARVKPLHLGKPDSDGSEPGELVAYLIVEDALDAWARSAHERLEMRGVLIRIADAELHLLGARCTPRCWREAFGAHGVLIARLVAQVAKRVLREREKRRVPEVP